MSETPRRERTIGLPRSRSDIGRDQQEEIEQHIAQRAGELLAAGLNAGAARAQAEREFGDVETARAQLARADERVYRMQRRRMWFGDLGADFRYAFRSLRGAPGFTFVVLTTLVLGMGATTAIFSVFNAYLLRPLPFPSSDRLVLVNDVQPNYGEAPASYEEFVDWKELEGPFDAVAALWRRTRNHEGGEYPERVRVGLVSERFFDLTAPRVVAGRLFTADEYEPGGAASMVVSESFWRSRLGGDRRQLGSTVRFDGESVTVVGVVEDLPHLWSGDQLVAFQPLAPNAPFRDRGTHYLTVWALLRSGVEVEHANMLLAHPITALQQERDTDHGIRAVPLRELIVGETRPLFTVTLVTVVLVLIIALANVANLMLARAARREQEFALRAALGAGRIRMTRQLLVEGLVLALLGGALGLAVGAAGARLLLRALPENMPRPPLVTLDMRVLALASAVVLGATLLFALAPLLVELRRTISSLLRGSRGDSSQIRGTRMRQALVVLELALSMVLLAGAALMVRSFTRLMQVDPGVRADGVVTFQLNLPASRYAQREQRAAFYQQLEERLARLPGVQSVGAAANLPLMGGSMNGDFTIEGTPTDAVRSQPPAEKRIVTPGYFDALGIELVSGRLIDERDRTDQPRVVLINETMARTMWPHENPLGRRIRSLSPEDAWEEIVGIVRDVRSEGLDRAPPLEILYPHAQHVSGSMVMIVRAVGAPESLVPQLRAEVGALDPQQPITNVRAMEDLVAQTIAGKRLLLLLSTGLGLLALTLAGVGTAGIVAYSVARRTREIGVRVAIGAPPRAIVALILAEALTLAVIGVVIGLVGAVVLGDTLRSQLFETAPTDGAAYLGAMLTLIAAATIAAWIPARRVLQIDPLRAIRAE